MRDGIVSCKRAIATAMGIAMIILAAAPVTSWFSSAHAAQVSQQPIAGEAGTSEPRLSFEKIIAVVKAAGYHGVFSVEYEHALYEVKAVDSRGQRVELFVNPKSGELLRHPKTGKPMFEKIN